MHHPLIVLKFMRFIWGTDQKQNAPPNKNSTYINNYRSVNKTQQRSNNTQIPLFSKVRNHYGDLLWIIEVRGRNYCLWNSDTSIRDNGTVSIGCIVVCFNNFPSYHLPWKWYPHNIIWELLHWPETTKFMELCEYCEKIESKLFQDICTQWCWTHIYFNKCC